MLSSIYLTAHQLSNRCVDNICQSETVSGPTFIKDENERKEAHRHNHYMMTAGLIRYSNYVILSILFLINLRGIDIIGIPLYIQKNYNRNCSGKQNVGACSNEKKNK